MKNQLLIKRYAQALAQALADDGEYDRTRAELAEFDRITRENPDLRGALANPMIAAGRKAEIVRGVLEETGVSGKARRFVLLLAEYHRQELLAGILETLPSAWDEKKGVVSYLVTSAVPISEPQRRRLEAELERLEKSPVHLTYGLDEAVIGGLSVRKGNLIYDASLKGGLNRLREKILEG